MKNMCFLVIALLVLANSAFAQHGTAENGYYPTGYQGDTWTGEVVSANEQTHEITLLFTKNGKSENFVGIPEDGYLVHEHNGPTRPLKMSDIPIGRTVKVWYTPKNREDWRPEGKGKQHFSDRCYSEHQDRQSRLQGV